MTNLIRVEVDASELEAKLEDLEALEAKVEELTDKIDGLEDYLQELEAQASQETEGTEGTDMLAKFLTRDEIDEFVKEILREASISIDV
jgi:predicted nuclease with TOPRIM domain